jgi:hypothetical protein
MTEDPPHVKMEFIAESGETEWIWAKPIRLGSEVYFSVDNIPFTMKGIGIFDIVGWKEKEEEGESYIAFDGRIIESSGYRTIKLVGRDTGDISSRIDSIFEQFDIKYERGEGQVYAMAVSADIDFDLLVSELDRGKSEHLWSYELLS